MTRPSAASLPATGHAWTCAACECPTGEVWRQRDGRLLCAPCAAQECRSCGGRGHTRRAIGGVESCRACTDWQPLECKPHGEEVAR